MNLKFTPKAVDDLRRLKEFIAEKDKNSAQRTVRMLKSKIEVLLQHPRMGRVVQDIESCRDLIAQSFVVRYQIEGDTVWILRLWHHKELRLGSPPTGFHTRNS
jgi:addiction module RelE/StbE family toxin